MNLVWTVYIWKQLQQIRHSNDTTINDIPYKLLSHKIDNLTFAWDVSTQYIVLNFCNTIYVVFS